jgi:molybdopterin converting factor small subunit
VKVEVHLFATLAAYLPAGTSGDSVTLEVADGTTVGELVQVLKIPEHLDCMTVVNGRDVPSDHRLIDGDALSLFPPLAGGR